MVEEDLDNTETAGYNFTETYSTDSQGYYLDPVGLGCKMRLRRDNRGIMETRWGHTKSIMEI